MSAVSDGGGLVIGLVTCTGEAARQATERLFCDLITAAAGRRPIVMRPLSLPDAAGADEQTWHGIDGLIVTGMEPQAAALPLEPCWPDLQLLVDRIARDGPPVIWSCLAAHAAVLHQNGIARRPRAAKLSGVFACRKAADHPVLTNLPPSWRVPHSRCNELDEDALAACGYRILSRSAEAGADMFSTEANVTSLFIQGHPEYGQETLLLEYRRDVRRFLAGERDGYPDMPEHYFASPAIAALAAFREQALHRRSPAWIAAFPMQEAMAGLACPWRHVAVHLYANWLSSLAWQRRGRPGWAVRSFHPVAAAMPGLGR